jgi:hypothetical protein
MELENSHDNSFEVTTQATHANSIWNSSINFLKNSMFAEVD